MNEVQARPDLNTSLRVEHALVEHALRQSPLDHILQVLSCLLGGYRLHVFLPRQFKQLC